MSENTLLEIKNISCGYEKKEILKNISFSVNKGDVVGIIGPNGVGKTTLFRTISGILKPSNGEVLYKDKDVFSISPRDFAKEVAIIMQMQDILFPFSVEELVLMGRFPHINKFEPIKATDCEAVEEALQLADIYDLRKRLIWELSAGEKQRVIIAQGLAQKPILLLLDEPTAHLDITHQVQILNLIKKLNKQMNLTVLMILHDLNLASSYCDRLILLKEGRMFKQGTPNEILTFENIEEVYKTNVLVEKNPLSDKPYILLTSEEDNLKNE